MNEINDLCPDCDHGLRGGKPCHSCSPTYTKYPQFVEFVKNIRDKGAKFLISLIPDEKPTNPVKLKQTLTMIAVALGLKYFDEETISDITMYALGITDQLEIDAYVVKFSEELDSGMHRSAPILPEYTKYGQFVELIEKMRKGGLEFLLTQVPEEPPVDDVKFKQACILLEVARGIKERDATTLTEIVMFLMDIGRDEVDAYAEKFYKEHLLVKAA